MAVKFIDNLDDQTVDREQKSWAMGADEFASPTMLPDTMGAKLVNCVVEDNGFPRTRPGADPLDDEQLSAGARVQVMAFFDTPLLEYVFVSINASLRSWDGTTWATVGAYPFGANTIVAMAEGADKLYASDATGQWYSYTGAAWSGALGNTAADPPVGASIMVWHTNRMFATGTISGVYDQIYVSDLGDAGAGGWDATAWAFRVGRGEGERITALASGRSNVLWVGKEGSIYAVFTDPTATSAAQWVVSRVTDSVGCVGGKAMQASGDRLWVFGPDLALREIVPSAVQDTPFEEGPAITEPAKPYIDRINEAALSKVVVHKYGRYLFLALPLDGASDPNTVLVWNLRLRRPSEVAGFTLPAFIGVWTGWTPTEMINSRFGGKERLLIGDDDGFVNEWKDREDQTDDDTYLDNDVAVLATIRPRSWDFGGQRNPKDMESAEVLFKDSTGTAEVAAFMDDEEQFRWTVQLENVENELPVDLPFDLATPGPTRSTKNLDGLIEFREMFFEIEQKTAGRMELKSISASAFVNTQANE